MLRPTFTWKELAERELKMIAQLETLSQEDVEQKQVPLGQKGLIAFELLNVLPKAFCQEVVEITEEKAKARRKGSWGYPQEHQYMIDNTPLATHMWQRIKPFIPQTITMKGETWLVTGIRSRFRVHKYNPGQFFPPHYDAVYEKNANEKSLLSVMIYLNGPANDDGFSSGTTNFLNPENDQLISSVHPEPGKLLIFEHHLYHEGATVKDGRKYFMRNEVMYKRAIPRPEIQPLTNKNSDL